MQASLVIVSRNRIEELEKTLLLLQKSIDVSEHEVLVFLDGCTDDSFQLQTKMDWVNWYSSKKSIGASPARNALYKNAKGTILIGLDDDAHPLYEDFISRIVTVFNQYPTVGVLAFEEIKGIYVSNEAALEHKQKGNVAYLCSEFVGCGFAIRKEVYDATNGFPVWMDIYGEESCVSIEVLSAGFDILYTNHIAVNHRVNREERFQKGRNYFRFGKQLKNMAFYYLVYYRYPFIRIAKLFWHNFKKYGCKDWNYFKEFVYSIFRIAIAIPKVVRYRKPISKAILSKSSKLPAPKY